jgi:hypothetical protein
MVSLDKKKIDGYFLEGSDNELLLVLRGYDEEIFLSLIKKLATMRDTDIKKLTDKLEEHFYERDSIRKHSKQPRSKNKK